MGNTAQGLRSYLTPERGFDLVRMYLGLGLAARGVMFLQDPSFMAEAMPEGTQGVSSVATLIAAGHCLGGALLAVGLFTRVAAAVQVLPVLGALLSIHSGQELATENQSLEFSALVLAMLLFFAAFGSGPWSLDARRRARQGPSGAARAESTMQ